MPAMKYFSRKKVNRKRSGKTYAFISLRKSCTDVGSNDLSSVHWFVHKVVFSRLGNYFLIFCTKLGFNKCMKVMKSIFEENSHYAQTGLNRVFFEPEIIILGFFSKSFLLIFLKLHLMTGI